MLKKLPNSIKNGNAAIQILYPGLSFSTTETGIGSIGRIDQAKIPPGTTIAMHPHINDEILSYFRKGKVRHTDSEGFTEYISGSKLMLMKAGKSFFHEEEIMTEGGYFEGLQIFIRPGKANLTPSVTFYELPEMYSHNQWRLLASPSNSTPLQFTSLTWVYDILLDSPSGFTLPQLPFQNLTFLFYVFQGSTLINDQLILEKGESLIIKNEDVVFSSSTKVEIVLFVTDESSQVYSGGMYSGNQFLR